MKTLQQGFYLFIPLIDEFKVTRKKETHWSCLMWLCIQLLSCVRLLQPYGTVDHQASLSMEFSMEKILEWISFSRGPFWPRAQTCISHVSCIARWILYHWVTWEALQCLLNTISGNSLPFKHLLLRIQLRKPLKYQ